MNHPIQAITANGIGAILLLSLLLNGRRKLRNAGHSRTIFISMIIVNFVQCILEPATIALDGLQFSGAVPLLTVMNALLYINNIIFALLWMLYAKYRVHNTPSQKPKVNVLLFLPALVIICMGVANIFTPVFFTVSEENVYTRTNLFILPYVATYFYLFWGIITAYGISRKGNPYVFLPAVTFLLPICAASVAQYLFPGISLLWVGAALGLNSAYISMLEERSYVDTLSGAFSRHYLNQYLSNMPRLTHGEMAGIMLDIDKFKSINDLHGHLVGDDAIRDVGSILRRATRNRGMVFRYAGDEFVILANVENEEQIQEICQRVHSRAERFNAAGEKPYELSFSMGHTVYQPGENINAFLQRMDDAMYADKNQKA